MRAAVVTCLALLLFAGSCLAADGPSRPEYVDSLELICKPGAEATRLAVRGVRADVRSERLGEAAAKFSRAKRIFARTVHQIGAVPRPEADRETLARWFSALDREKFYLGRMIATLRKEDVPGFQRVSTKFIHEGNRANNVVVSFGFNYCSFRPTRFQ
jgi:hypothetical protein